MLVEDIIQIGMLGLISAAQNYTPQNDASFASYASIRIRGEILDFLRKSSNFTILFDIFVTSFTNSFMTFYSPYFRSTVPTSNALLMSDF